MTIHLKTEGDERLLHEGQERHHEAIGEGLAQLDRGEGVPGDVSRARLQEKKAVWIDQFKKESQCKLF
jgi:hypothetical protein